MSTPEESDSLLKAALLANARLHSEHTVTSGRDTTVSNGCPYPRCGDVDWTDVKSMGERNLA
jgi:hypothetical protein